MIGAIHLTTLATEFWVAGIDSCIYNKVWIGILTYQPTETLLTKGTMIKETN